VLVGSDYPHPIADLDGILSRVNALAPDLRDAVRGRNAAQLFGLDVD
jgi:hypothetical protein